MFPGRHRLLPGARTSARPVLERGSRVIVVGVVLIGALAACSGTSRPDAGGARPSAGWESVPPERADVRFETAGAPEVIAARRRAGPDGVRFYEVSLANRTLDFGENKVIVAMRERADGQAAATESDLVAFDFTPALIDQNFELLLQGARRASAPVARRNRYGPYHFLAAEYPGSSRCVYAWQQVEGGFAATGRAGGAATLQFRFCDPEQTPAEMIEMFDRLVVDL
ncbi:MAG TPA: cellulose biosynthesis protein BcsN [Geminicoccaceae bacterium]